MFNKTLTFIKSGNARTLKAKKNIIASFGIKGASIVIGFLMIRVTLDYLDQTKYGIWLTLSSFLTWFTFFEVGLGNGLRNKLAEALADKNYSLGKIYVSTTYALLSIVIGIVAFLFLIANPFLDWSKILNTDTSLKYELSNLALIVFGFFFLRFVFKLIGIVLFADQRPAIANSFGPIGNFFSLIVIFILTKTTSGSLIYLGWTLSTLPVIVLVIASFYFYNTKYKNISPSFKFIKFKYASDILGLGVKFFIIQVSALVLYQSSNIIIIQYFGPKEVTSYNIAFKYFSVIHMVFTIIMTPYWSAYTEAWKKNEILWIRKTILGLLKVFLGFILLGLIIIIVSDDIFNIWIGKEQMKEIQIDFSLKITLLLSFLLRSFGGIYNMFINGTGKLQLQMVSLLFGAIIFIPISILGIEYFHLGITSVVIATILANIYSPILAPIQYYKLIKHKANGIWNK